MRCRCCAGFRTVCHDTSIETGWRACAHKSGQSSTREPADSDLQGEVLMDPALVNGRRVDFHVFDLAGSIGAREDSRVYTRIGSNKGKALDISWHTVRTPAQHIYILLTSPLSSIISTCCTPHTALCRNIKPYQITAQIILL